MGEGSRRIAQLVNYLPYERAEEMSPVPKNPGKEAEEEVETRGSLGSLASLACSKSSRPNDKNMSQKAR